MNVAGDDVAPSVFVRPMPPDKRQFDANVLDDLYGPFGRRLAAPFVVIAEHQRDVEAAMAVPPCGDSANRAGRLAAPRVNEVAEDDEALGLRSLDCGRKATEVGVGRRFGNRQRGGAKRSRFAEMQVGDEQRPSRGPKDRSFREQPERFIGDLDHDGAAGKRHAHLPIPDERPLLGVVLHLHLANAVGEFFGTELVAKPIDDQRERHRRRPR